MKWGFPTRKRRKRPAKKGELPFLYDLRTDCRNPSNNMLRSFLPKARSAAWCRSQSFLSRIQLLIAPALETPPSGSQSRIRNRLASRVCGRSIRITIVFRRCV